MVTHVKDQGGRPSEFSNEKADLPFSTQFLKEIRDTIEDGTDEDTGRFADPVGLLASVILIGIQRSVEQTLRERSF